MTWQTLAWLTAAGVAAGVVGTVAGLASLVSYPALVAAGLGPVAANVTNTVALIGNAIGGVHGSRPELAGQGPRVRRLLLPGVIGGLLGGGLLLLTPSAAFERIVPWLIGLGAVAVLVRPRPADVSEHHARRRHDRWLWWGILAISVYGGYFGAAAGVLMLALLLFLTGETVARGSAVRTAVLSTANGVAALAFAVFGPVNWPAALALGAGFVAGSRAGPVLLRHSPDRALRVVIALAGVGLAVKLGVDAYGGG